MDDAPSEDDSCAWGPTIAARMPPEPDEPVIPSGFDREQEEYRTLSFWVSVREAGGYNGGMWNLPKYHPDWGRFRNHKGLVTRPAIKKLVERIAEKFQPEQIILFGSYVYGKPDEWSDVDLLIVMPARNQIDQSIRIWNALDPPFSVDLIVRTPKNMKWRLEEGDWFLREIVGKGKVMYEKADGGMAAKSRGGCSVRKKSAKRKAARS